MKIFQVEHCWEYVDIRHTLNGNVVSVVPATRWRPACLNT